ncbi:MAG: CPBP family intramembrane metalloprotease [Acidobacteriales bacterium]|nr:CPBP family intramembrane metalloprotease [Terriglobales bacterium]
MSSPQNPWLEPVLPPVAKPSPLAASSRGEDPVWNGWDVLQIACLMLFTPFLFIFVAGFALHQLRYPGLPLAEIVQKPMLALVSEFLGYLVVAFYMVVLIEGRYHRKFSEAIRWNWPVRSWAALCGLGVLLLFVLQGLAHFLPIPKNLPFDRFFEHPAEAYLTSIFAIGFGPLMEELFFRGFLYPVLARRLGIFFAVALTSVAFGLVHALQLGYAWSAVLVIFFVGLALTLVRALTHSVAASFLVHVAYNSTLTVLTLIATGGFRHMERLNQ